MRKRTGDWRDLLSAYSLALDAKKVCMGLVAVVASVAIIAMAAFLYAWLLADLGRPDGLALLGMPGEQESLLLQLMDGKAPEALKALLPLLNPFHGGLGHLVLSALMYAALFWVWTGAGGVVSRLAALEYARDDLPTLAEARDTVRSRRRAYFLAPLMPFLFILLLCALNALGGLVASIPVVGHYLLIPGFPLLAASTVVIVFLLVLGVLSFGMMMPAVSVGGKDGFESWSTAYSYVLWGLRRFICYSLLACVLGVIAVSVAGGLTHLLVYLMVKTASLGHIGGTDWIAYSVNRGGVSVMPIDQGAGFLLALLFLLLRLLPAAYLFSYFFTASTVIFLLMRKDQDSIDIDDICEEAEEAEEPEAVEETPKVDAAAPSEAPAQPTEPERGQPEEETAGDEEDEVVPPAGASPNEETT